jgi:hypothetical protein
MRPVVSSSMPLQREPQGVHGVLGVIPVDRDQFGPVGVRAGLPGHRRLLGLQVAQVPARGQQGDEPVGVSGQLGAGLVAEDDVGVGDEQHQQHGRVPGQASRAHLRAE